MLRHLSSADLLARADQVAEILGTLSQDFGDQAHSGDKAHHNDEHDSDVSDFRDEAQHNNKHGGDDSQCSDEAQNDDKRDNIDSHLRGKAPVSYTPLTPPTKRIS